MGMFKMNIKKLFDALKASKDAQEIVAETPVFIDDAVSLTQDVQIDLSDFVGISSDMKEETEFILTISEIIGKIISDGITNEEELLEVLNTQGIEVFAGILSSLLNNGYLDSEKLDNVILPNMVRNGNLSVEDLGKVISSMYESGTIKNEDIGIILYELKRTNMVYVIDSNGFGNYQKQLNDLYGYDFNYVTLDANLNERTLVGEYNEGNIAFRIRSNYTFDLKDLNTILKPMYDSGQLNSYDLSIITSPLQIFNQPTSNPDIYDNPDYNKYLKRYGEDNDFELTIGNNSYEVNDTDRNLIKNVVGYTELVTGDDGYDNILADVWVSDFVVAVHSVEVGQYKNSVDEALAVGSLLMNRTESTNWNAGGQGESIVYQLERGVGVDPSGTVQYQPVNERTYLNYTNGKTFSAVETGIKDSMNGIRNNDCTGFWGAGNGSVSIGGNSFHHCDTNPSEDLKSKPETCVPYERNTETGLVEPGTKFLKPTKASDIYEAKGDSNSQSIPEATSKPNNPETTLEEPESTPSPTPSATPSPTPSATPSPTPSATPSPTPSVTPSPTPSVTPSPTPSATPSPTPSATPSPTPSATPSPTIPSDFDEIIYEVQSGDTLGDIARRYGLDYNDIAKDNNILDPNYIVPGQKIVIKSAMVNNNNNIIENNSSLNTTYDTSENINISESTTIKYVVQPGDTLGDIARRYGLDYNDIAKDNNISDPNLIINGQEIIINIKN